jgi:perosamine synthetase
MERYDDILARKRALARRYRERLEPYGAEFQVARPGMVGSDWLVSFLVPPGVDRDRLMSEMEAEAVETRPVFFPAHHMPMYQTPIRLPVAEDIAGRGVSIPSYPALTETDQDRVIEAFVGALEAQTGRRTRSL